MFNGSNVNVCAVVSVIVSVNFIFDVDFSASVTVSLCANVCNK